MLGGVVVHILVIGLNHKTAPIYMREKFSISDDTLKVALNNLRKRKSILECVLVSTCNRLEMYLVCDQLHTGKYCAKTFLEEWSGVLKGTFQQHLYIKESLDTVTHLFRLVCGLDSLIIGETQILGQVRNAFLFAQASGTTGTIFNHLFRQAIMLGKYAHRTTGIGRNAVSTSSAAITLLKHKIKDLHNKRILFIGTGRMNKIAAQHLVAHGARQFCFINRTYKHAQKFAHQFNGISRYWDELRKALLDADIVISSTSSSTPILTASLMKTILPYRESSLTMVDIAVPRDIEPTVHKLENINLYNIDDLYGIIDQNKEFRLREGQKLRARILKEKLDFEVWLHQLGVLPLIRLLQKKATVIQEETMNRIERKLPELTDYELKVIQKQTKSIVHQLLKEPIIRLKELASTSQKEKAIEMFTQLYALEEQLDDLKENGSDMKIITGL
jgi:glutamyl-tRNA reductase